MKTIEEIAASAAVGLSSGPGHQHDWFKDDLLFRCVCGASMDAMHVYGVKEALRALYQVGEIIPMEHREEHPSQL